MIQDQPNHYSSSTTPSFSSNTQPVAINEIIKNQVLALQRQGCSLAQIEKQSTLTKTKLLKYYKSKECEEKSMNKVSLQAFSAGIIFSTAIMAGFYYGNHVNKKGTFTTSEAKKMLEAQGYSISKGYHPY